MRDMSSSKGLEGHQHVVRSMKDMSSGKGLEGQMRRLPGLLDLLDTDVTKLNAEMQKPVLDPVHMAAKNILCCQLPRILYRLW